MNGKHMIGIAISLAALLVTGGGLVLIDPLNAPRQKPEPQPIDTPNKTNCTFNNSIVSPVNKTQNKTRDYDEDGMEDDDELLRGTDPCDYDTDDDGLDDFVETYDTLTNPLSNDTDNDTLLDNIDPAPLNNSSDIDGDGVLDQFDIDWYNDVFVDLYLNYSVQMNASVWLTLFVSFPVDQLTMLLMVDGSNASGQSNRAINWPDSQNSINMSLNIQASWFTNDTVDALVYQNTWSFSHNYGNGTIDLSVRME